MTPRHEAGVASSNDRPFDDAELQHFIDERRRATVARRSSFVLVATRRAIAGALGLVNRFRHKAADVGLVEAVRVSARFVGERARAHDAEQREISGLVAGHVDPMAVVSARLSVAASALGLRPSTPESPSDLLASLVQSARAEPRSSAAWLLIIAVTGAMPRHDDVVEVQRAIELEASTSGATRAALAVLGSLRWSTVAFTREMRITTNRTLVDVTLSARTDHNTGIQRVVRALSEQWNTEQSVDFVVWDDGDAILRHLSESERHRLLHWGADAEPAAGESATASLPIVVPFDCAVVVAEVPAMDSSERLGAAARHGAVTLHAIGYDTIPIVSAHLLPPNEAEKFASYLGMITHAASVAAISETAAEEFRGFAAALAAQNLEGPRVTTVVLPTLVSQRSASTVEHDRSRPLVLAVGSHEPRKNHAALLFAAEVLWREGLDFEVELIGRGSSEFIAQFDRMVRRLQVEGRPVLTRRDVDDHQLEKSYRDAFVTVFTSLHEGFGLPIVESLACGTPVITTDYGSTREVGVGGGCVLIDPRDDRALVDALRRVLTEPGLRSRLSEEARSRPRRTWADYAEELRLLIDGPVNAA